MFLTHYAALYGANRSLIDLLNGLKKYPLIPIVIVPEAGPLTQYFKCNAIKHYIIPFKTGVEYRWKSKSRFNQFARNIFFLAKAILKFLKNRFYLTEIVKIARKETIHVIYTNSSVITIGHYLSKKLNIPQIFHVRESIIDQFSLYPDFGRNYYSSLITKSTHQIFISQYLKNQCLTGKIKSSSSILHDGVSKPDFKIFKTKKEPQIFSIGVIGYLCRQKNQIEVLQAFSLIKDCPAELLIIGDGDFNKLKRIAINLGIEGKIRFVGFQNNIDSFYSNLDVVVVSAVNEALGRVTIEAMMRGIPVIGKNSGATPELIEDEVTGLLYNSQQDLADKIKYLISNSYSRLQIAKIAQLKATNTFDLNVYSDKIFRIIERCIN